MPSFRSATSSLAAASGSPLVIDKPSGVIEGDWLVGINVTGATADRWYNPPDGSWSLLGAAVTTLSGVGNYYFRVYIKKATASEPANYSFPASYTFIQGRLTLLAIANSSDHADNPFGIVVSGTEGSVGNTNSPSIAPIVNDSLILRLFAHSRGSGDVTSVVSNTKRSLFNTGSFTHVIYTEVASVPTGVRASLYTPTWHEGYSHVVLSFSPIVALPPEAFDDADWAVADATTGSRLLLLIDALPTSVEAITDIEYRLDGGSAVSTGLTTTDIVVIAGLTNGQAYNVEVRAVSANGAGPWSSVKAATPTIGGGGGGIGGIARLLGNGLLG